jgi:hypothetical protein
MIYKKPGNVRFKINSIPLPESMTDIKICRIVPGNKFSLHLQEEYVSNETTGNQLA